MRTFSMAPSAPGMPKRNRPPSKAGPAGLDAATMRLPVADDDLGVGADVDEHRRAGLAREVRGHQVRRDIPADVAGHERRAHDAALRVHEEAQLVGTARQPRRVGLAAQHGQLGDRLVGHLADGLDVQAEEEVTHRGVAHHHGLVDHVPVDTVLRVDRLELAVEGPSQRLAQGTRVVALVGDARHHVAATEALRVLEGTAGEGVAAGQIDDAEDHRRGAHVDGQTQHLPARLVDGDALVADGVLRRP